MTLTTLALLATGMPPATRLFFTGQRYEELLGAQGVCTLTINHS